MIRHLERLPIEASFPAIIDRIAEVTEGAQIRTGQRPYLYVDVTGLGQPVIDLLESRIEAHICSVFFTHGDRRTKDRRLVTLGKAFLVTRLQVLLQAGRMHLPKTPESRTLRQELLEFQVRVEPDANDHYGAFRVGSYDDLVTALGLAVQTDESEMPVVEFGNFPPWG